MTGFHSKRISAVSRHADPTTMDHIIALRHENERLMHENTVLKDEIWLLQQELKRIEKEPDTSMATWDRKDWAIWKSERGVG
jgi:hypothetical protein